MNKSPDLKILNVDTNISVQTGSKFKFSGIANFFDSHVKKSIPLYPEGHWLISSISDFFVSEKSVFYDIGCSTGTLIASLAEKYHTLDKAKFIGIDIEEDMINFAMKKFSRQPNLFFILNDVLKMDFEPCNLIIAYYILQFIQPSDKKAMLQRVFDSLKPGGGFILFDKTIHAEGYTQDLFSQVYTDFKLMQGFLHEEILNKSKSIRGILTPNTTEENKAIMKSVGFKKVFTLMKFCQFEGHLAIK